jgi:hypothetical protein
MNLVDELPKRHHVREPPVQVIVSRPLDDEQSRGLLWGWADAPDGRTGGLRGLVTYTREYAPGFSTDVVSWALLINIRQPG